MWRYYAFRFAGLTIARLPRRIGYLIAWVVSGLVYLLSPGLRASIKDNMKHVLGPEATEAALNKAARNVLKNTARNYFDLIHLPYMKLKTIESSVSLHNLHNFEDALNRGKGVILTTAHLGSFDMAVQILASHSVKTTIPVEPLEPPSLLKHVTSLRRINGISFVPAQSGILETMLKSLRRGEVVLLACDRDINRDGLRLSFFGEETTLPTLAVRLAMRTGAAVVPAFTLRQEDGGYDIYVEPALDILPGGKEAVAGNMEQLAGVMEKYIKRFFEQWVVLSRLWTGDQ